ncbi:MAG: SAF domain-containing protein [Acidimicrobiales bacterium]
MQLWHLYRHPAARWAVALALAAATAVIVTNAESSADAARRSWGSTRPVVVAAHDLGAGAVVADGDFVLRAWPVAVVPAGALREAPIGRALRAEVVAGEALVDARVAGFGVAGTAAIVADGWRALAIATGQAALAVVPGDVVDLYATVDPAAGASGPPTVQVATSARVVAVDERSVTVAVPEERVARVAFAAATGTVTLALVGASGS